MKKYKTLESLSKIIIFIAWLTLISGIIISIYSIAKKLGTILILSSIIGGIFWFIFLLGFGKLIQLTLDLYEKQTVVKQKKQVC